MATGKYQLEVIGVSENLRVLTESHTDLVLDDNGSNLTTRLSTIGTATGFSLTLTGDVSGSVTKTALSSGTLTLQASVADDSHNHSGATVVLDTGSRVVVSAVNKSLSESAVTTTELGYLSGVTSSIQTQLNTISSSRNIALSATQPTNQSNGGIWFEVGNSIGNYDFNPILVASADEPSSQNVGGIWLETGTSVDNYESSPVVASAEEPDYQEPGGIWYELDTQ